MNQIPARNVLKDSSLFFLTRADKECTKNETSRIKVDS